MNDTNVTNNEATKIGKIAIQLFAWMQQCRLNAAISQDPSNPLTYHFVVNDLTNTGDAFGIGFDLSSKDVTAVEDNPAAIEQFCFGITIKTGVSLLTEKATRLLQYAEEPQKSRIILPGQ